MWRMNPLLSGWFSKQQPLLRNARNIHARNNRQTVFSVVRVATVAMQQHGKHAPARTKEMFSVGPCRDVTRKTTGATEFSSVRDSPIHVTPRLMLWDEYNYLTTLSVAELWSIEKLGERWMANLKQRRRKRSWPSRGTHTIPKFFWRDWGIPWKASVTVAGVPPKIRTVDLPNTSLETYCYSNPLGSGWPVVTHVWEQETKKGPIWETEVPMGV
jgi:hypothetical protein